MGVTSGTGRRFDESTGKSNKPRLKTKQIKHSQIKHRRTRPSFFASCVSMAQTPCSVCGRTWLGSRDNRPKVRIELKFIAIIMEFEIKKMRETITV
jgi:hypothetical protein